MSSTPELVRLQVTSVLPEPSLLTSSEQQVLVLTDNVILTEKTQI